MRYHVRQWYDCPCCHEPETVEVTVTVAGRRIVEEEVTQQHCPLDDNQASELERQAFEELIS